MPELTTAPVETAIDTADELYFNDVSETPDALNRITFGNFRTSVLSGVIDLGGATSFELPNSATPTVDADGEIAVDTSVADFSHGILKYFGGEEMAVIAVPIAQLTTPTNGYVIAYNATNDEFELVAPSGGGIGGSTGSTDNAILRADGTGGATAQGSGSTAILSDAGELRLDNGTSQGLAIYNSGNFVGGLHRDASFGGLFLSSAGGYTWIQSGGSATGVRVQAAASGGVIEMMTGSTEVARFDTNSTAGNTRMLVYDVDNATLERVSVGAADSGGSGFKVLRIPN